MRLWIFVSLTFASTLPAQITFPPDLTISRLEVVQTTQDDAQTVPLIANKATAARAFVRQTGRPEALISGVTVVLRAFRDGAELPTSPLRAVNPAITASPSPDRTKATDAQNFILPASWTMAGRLDIRAELRVPTGAVEV